MTPEEERALAVDGDRYHAVNHNGIGTIADPPFDQMKILHSVSPIVPVLEIGCTTGFRLNKAHHEFGARAVGIEASESAVKEGKELYPNIELHQGMAPRDLDIFQGEKFDLIILGHFLYLLPRPELFRIAADVDALLNDGGHVMVMDFIFFRDTVSRYSHQDALRVFKGDPSAPWTWSPQYFLVHRSIYELATDQGSQNDAREWQTLDVVRKMKLADVYDSVDSMPSRHVELR